MSATFQAGRVAYVQQEALSALKGLIDAGDYDGAVEFLRVPVHAARIGDLAGALNYWASLPTLPVVVVADYLPNEGRRLFAATDSEIIAFPFTLASGGKGYASASEYGVGPALRFAKISSTPGDIAGGPVGNQNTIDFDLPPGRYFYSTVLVEGYPMTQSGFSVSFPP